MILTQQWFLFKIRALKGAGHVVYVAPRVASPPTRSRRVEKDGQQFACRQAQGERCTFFNMEACVGDIDCTHRDLQHQVCNRRSCPATLRLFVPRLDPAAPPATSGSRRKPFKPHAAGDHRGTSPSGMGIYTFAMSTAIAFTTIFKYLNEVDMAVNIFGRVYMKKIATFRRRLREIRGQYYTIAIPCAIVHALQCKQMDIVIDDTGNIHLMPVREATHYV